ncbi:hypothetical protein Hanom_Chr05g00410721 [Helianthus anomalus]
MADSNPKVVFLCGTFQLMMVAWIAGITPKRPIATKIKVRMDRYLPLIRVGESNTMIANRPRTVIIPR